MTNWKDTVRTDEFDDLVADVSVNFLQQDIPVSLQFLGAETLTPEAEAAADALLQRLPDLEKLVANTAFEHYQRELEYYKRHGGEVDIPVVKEVSVLYPLYQLHHIYLPEEPEEGRFGLGFECEWEIEHGFGLQFRNWKIVEIGGEAEAFSFYD